VYPTCAKPVWRPRPLDDAGVLRIAKPGEVDRFTSSLPPGGCEAGVRRVAISTDAVAMAAPDPRTRPDPVDPRTLVSGAPVIRELNPEPLR